MITFYIFFAILSSVSYFMNYKFGFWVRIFISVIVFIVPSLFLTFFILKVGDEPPANSKIISRDEINNKI